MGYRDSGIELYLSVFSSTIPVVLYICIQYTVCATHAECVYAGFKLECVYAGFKLKCVCVCVSPA